MAALNDFVIGQEEIVLQHSRHHAVFTDQGVIFTLSWLLFRYVP